MSRIGNKLINIPDGINVQLEKQEIKVKGTKGELSFVIPNTVSVEINENQIKTIQEKETKSSHALQGLTRSLINNMITGVSQGFKKELEVIGVGYKVQVQGKILKLNLGFSHPIDYDIPDGIKITIADNNKIIVEGIDKQLVGQVAANIRFFRPPEPYKGKGIRYSDERIILKEGKSSAKK